MSELTVTQWPADTPVTAVSLEKLLEQTNLTFYRWSNGPHDIYAAHTHPYNKVIIVAQGSIAFGLPQLNRTVQLQAGDRLDLPKDVLHNAIVGSDGVVCYEAHIHVS